MLYYRVAILPPTHRLKPPSPLLGVLLCRGVSVLFSLLKCSGGMLLVLLSASLVPLKPTKRRDVEVGIWSVEGLFFGMVLSSSRYPICPARLPSQSNFVRLVHLVRLCDSPSASMVLVLPADERSGSAAVLLP